MSLIAIFATDKSEEIGFDGISVLIMHLVEISLLKKGLLFLVFERDSIPDTEQTHNKRHILRPECKCAFTYS